MNKQRIIEKRILALAKVVSNRLKENPEFVIAKAKSNIKKWSANQHEKYHDEWLTILDGSLNDILEVLNGEDQNSIRLRSSSPFAGIISQKERWNIIKAIK